jgi:hypothetical protein
MIEMSKTGIILFINALNEDENFSFGLSIFEQILNYSWIEPTVQKIFELLNEEKVPEKTNYCKYCNYYFSIKDKIND